MNIFDNPNTTFKQQLEVLLNQQSSPTVEKPIINDTSSIYFHEINNQLLTLTANTQNMNIIINELKKIDTKLDNISLQSTQPDPTFVECKNTKIFDYTVYQNYFTLMLEYHPDYNSEKYTENVYDS